MKDRYRISIDKERCVLCRYCEVVCSMALRGEFQPDASVIKEVKPEGGVTETTCLPPESCRGAPKCVGACDARALSYAKAGLSG